MDKIYFINLGCPRNLVDTEIMLGIVLEAGYGITDDTSEADFFVINTCGFIKDSRNEALDVISEIIEEKKSSAKLIITGCMVAKHRKILEKHFPEIHYFLGAGNITEILQALSSKKPGLIVKPPKSFLEDGTEPRKLTTPPHYAYLKIAEGCRKNCSYCAIPAIKGPLRSKATKQILQEFQNLLNQGVYEIILIAQDLGDYGKDSGENLASLLKQILKIDGDYWLRLLYLYPDEITDEIIEIIRGDERICKYVDMPIQHVNGDILRSMKRKTSKKQIKDTITKLRSEIPEMVIRTSIIVGFPGETDQQFEELIEFIKEYPLDHIGVFVYSPEENTPAAKLPQQIPEELKNKRYDKIMTAQQEILALHNKKMIGKSFPVIIEGYHPESEFLMVGRYYGQCPEIDSQIIINDHLCVDKFGCKYMVEITDVAGYDLIGTAKREM